MNIKIPIYWKNPYLTSIETKILSINGNEIILEDDIFYPESGGQESDIGFLIVGNEKKAKIIHVFKKGEKSALKAEIYGELKKGEMVIAKIDSERRNSLMRAHTAQHLLSAFLSKEGIETVHAEIHPDEFIVEADKKISLEVLTNVIDKSNNAIFRGVKVHSRYFTPEELEKQKLSTRKPLKKAGNIIRVIDIENIDQTFCGGTHVDSLSKIGLLLPLSYGKKFIHISTGKKSLKIISKENSKKINLARELTTSPEQVFETLDLLYQKTKAEISSKDRVFIEFLKQIMSKKEIFTQKIHSYDVLVLPELPFNKKQLNKVIRLLKEKGIQNYILISMDGYMNIDFSSNKSYYLAEKLFDVLSSRFECKGGGKKGKYTLKLSHKIRYREMIEIIQEL